MGVFIEDKKLFYAPVPKIACTSVKLMFFEVQNGYKFSKFKANGKIWHIHEFYKGLPRKSYPEKKIADYRRLTLVRDPIKRFLSGYGNRVVYHDKVDAEAIKRTSRFRSLTPKPELDEFVDRFESYLKIPDINWHFNPMVEFLGDDPDYFHGIYPIQNMDGFAEDVSNVLGRPVEIGREQTGGPKLSPDMLSAKQRAKLRKFYKADYDAFSRHF